jgi:hypothetical protein
MIMAAAVAVPKATSNNSAGPPGMLTAFPCSAVLDDDMFWQEGGVPPSSPRPPHSEDYQEQPEEQEQLPISTKTTKKTRRPKSTTTAAKNKKQKTKPANGGALSSSGCGTLNSRTTTAAAAATGDDTTTTATTTRSTAETLLSVLHTSSRSLHAMVVRTTPVAAVKPMTVLQNLLKKHGMPSLRIRAVNNNHHSGGSKQYQTTNPAIMAVNELRKASFGSKLLTAVDASDIVTLRWLFAHGVSPNPCNKFADDVLFTICKRSAAADNAVVVVAATTPSATTTTTDAVFDCFIDHGTNVRVVDANGRTCLHYCAWAETFNEHIVATILRQDPYQLFREDYRGQTPLDHVHDSVAADWNAFLQQHFNRLYYRAGQWPEMIQAMNQQQQQQNTSNNEAAATAAAATTSPWTARQLDDVKELVGSAVTGSGRTKGM